MTNNPPDKQDGNLPAAQDMPKGKKKGNDLILSTMVSGIAYIIIIFAFFLFWTGHNAPGGGFVAGLMLAAVVVLLYVSFGSSFMQNTLRFDFKYLIAIGLSLALGCGIGGIIAGQPFLTHTFTTLHLGFFGELELATATIFDLGVFLTVTGGCVTIITSIGESRAAAAKASGTKSEEATDE